MQKIRPKQVLWVVLGVSVLLRLAAAVYLGNEVVILPGTTDQLSYHNLGLRLVAGHGFTFGEPWWPLTRPDEPTAHWSFLYSLYVALVYQIFGPNPIVARLIQVVAVGILQPYLAYLMGRRLFNEWTGVAAAGLTAVYFYFIYYGGTLMTEPFYITAILASLYVTILMAEPERKTPLRWGVLLGLLLGITVLLRQLYMLFVPFQILWLWWARYKGHGRVPWAQTIVAGLVVVGMILPFTYYNYIRFDRFVLLNTNAGYAFYLGNHPIYGTRFIPILDNYLPLIPDDLPVREMDEAALDQEFLKRGIGFITDDPARYILLSLSRTPIYFTFWPTSDSDTVSNLARVGSFGLMLPFMLYGVVLALRRQWGWSLLQQPIFLLLLFCLVYTSVHLLTWALIRYRLPVDAVLLVFAGYGLVDLAERLLPRFLPRLAARLAG